MTNKKLVIEYSEYAGVDELSELDKELMQSAMRATESAYAPYSHFCVGAAVRLANGIVVTGSNQENIAYPSGLCAERTALFAAAAQYPGQAVVALAVVGRDADGLFTEASPCGACRQVMAEFEQRYGNQMTVFCYLQQGRIRCIKGIENLLPFGFDADL